MIVADGLGKTFRSRGDDVEAVQSVSFSVDRGEVFAVVGPNGAGKSTTIQMLVALVRPTRGTARVAGHDVVEEAAQVRASIGVALQETGLDEMLTAHELLRLHAALLDGSRRRARARAAMLLEQVGLEHAADRRIGTYSGGMRRQLDLALALVTDPPVVILDEPTTGLDPMSRRAIWDEIRAMRERGATVLLSTQQLDEADALADRLAIVDHGRVIAEGSPDALKRRVGGDRIELTLEDEAAAATLAALLVRERATTDGHVVRVTAEDGRASVPAILGLAQEHGLAVRALSMTEPSLEEAFLLLAGKRIVSAPEAAAR